MKRSLALLSYGENTRRVLSGQLEEVLGGLVDIATHAIESGLPDRVEADLVLVTHHSIIPDVRACVGDSPLLSARRMVNFAHVDRLLGIPPQSRVLLVNDTRETALETIELLNGLGISHVHYIPSYPGARPAPADLAVTPGELPYVPAGIGEVMDLGPRLIDFTTMVEVLERLGLLNERANVVTARYMRELVRRGQQLVSHNRAMATARGQLETILRVVDQGVIAVDRDGEVVFANPRAKEILGDSDLKILDLAGTTVSGRAETRRIYRVGESQIVVSKVPFGTDEGPGGAVATLSEAREIQDIEHRLREETKARGLGAKYSFADIVGESVAMKEAKRRAVRLAESDATVLIQGESGTGKELFAQAIHSASTRHGQPFVAVNCAALPETLLESELFGYEEGAFTGARKGGKPGLFELAHQGTIFLDEIGETPLPLQARLLRVLQEREVMRIGGTRVIPVDVRIIAATHRPLERLRTEGAFRDDLYYRLNVLPLVIPPLRERLEDIPYLADALWRNLARQRVWPYRKLSADVFAHLCRYTWPGNVRELENALTYAASMVKGAPGPDDFPPYLARCTPAAEGGRTETAGLGPLDTRILRMLAGEGRGRKTLACRDAGQRRRQPK